MDPVQCGSASSAVKVMKTITRRSNFADRGGVGYSYLLDTFAPMACEAGVPEQTFEKLLYRNALRIYKGQSEASV